MSTWLTITWDENRLLFLTAKGTGKDVVFEAAASVSLHSPSDKSGMFRAVSPAEARQIPETVAEQILDFVRKQRLGKAETVFVVGRSDVEVRPMSFPPIPVDEIPDVIRFQAAKEFNRYDQNTPLDFFLLKDPADSHESNPAFVAVDPNHKTAKNAAEPANGKSPNGKAETGPRRKLLASIVRRELLQEIADLCKTVGLNLRRVVLHPCEATFLWKQSPQYDPRKTYMIVEVDPTEALLTVLHRGQAVFMRSPRLFGERSERMKIAGLSGQIVSEIKRTVIAVRNEMHAVAVDQAIVFGNSEQHRQLAAALFDSLPFPVDIFDPWKGIKKSGMLSKILPETSELFAPLIGSTLLAARGIPSDIDYLNPKRKPPNLGYRQRLTVIGFALAMLLFFALGFGFWRNNATQKEIRILESRKAKLVKEFEEVSKQGKLIAAIESWESGRYDWLKQLDWFSRMAPTSQNLYLTGLDIRVQAGGAGVMEMKGVAKDLNVVTKMVEHLQDKTHLARVNGVLGTSKTTNVPEYPLPFDISVFISHQENTSGTAEYLKNVSAVPPTEEQPSLASEKPASPPQSGEVPIADPEPEAKTDSQSAGGPEEPTAVPPPAASDEAAGPENEPTEAPAEEPLANKPEADEKGMVFLLPSAAYPIPVSRSHEHTFFE